MKYEAIVFDFDNTLIHSIPYHDQAYIETFKPYGLNLNVEYLHTTIGSLPREVVGKVIKDYSLDLPIQKMEAAFYDLLKDYINQIESIAPDLSEFVKKAKSLGYKLGVASASRSDIVTKMLGRFNLLNNFDAVIGGESVKKGKPSPDMIIKCLDVLEIDPKKAIAIDDARSGISAAKSIGMFTIGYTKYSQKPLPEADLSVDEFNQIVLDKYK